MTVAFVIAFLDLGDPARRKAFDHVYEYVRTMAERFGAELRCAGAETKSKALNRLIGAAEVDVVAQVDPDSLVPSAALATAIELAAFEDGLVVPHDRYLYLTQSSTEQVYKGRFPFSFDESDCEFSGLLGVGNATVYSYRTWEAVGGYDERFGMWGGDDAVFAYSAEALTNPTRRIQGDAVHLWHPRPPESEPGHPGYVHSFGLLSEFRDAAAEGPDAVRALIEAR